MERNTMIGIAIAIVIILFALYLILRKPKASTPSLDADLHINPETNQPVLPRFVRQQLDRAAAEPQPEEETVTQVAEYSEVATPKEQVADDKPSDIDDTVVVDSKNLSAKDSKDHTGTEQENTPKNSKNTTNEEVNYRLNPDMEKAQIQAFEDESAILDQHLHAQQRSDDESALATAEHIVALNIYPIHSHVLSGDRALQALLKYGLRFGELACFHRYEDINASNTLMFSVLRITEEGPVGFDLESLSTEQIQGLAFFLALPHAHPQQGFDTMISIAALIARDLGGQIFDENNVEFSPQLKEHLRHQVIDFKSS